MSMASSLRIIDYEYFKNIPWGYRFSATDKELIIEFLIKKIKNQSMPRNWINVVDFYEFNPEELADKYSLDRGEKEWFFFTRKYNNMKTSKRVAGDGYWKVTGADKTIKQRGKPVGFRKTFQFYKGKPGCFKGTPWFMHELRVDNTLPGHEGVADDVRLDDWVLCKIYRESDSDDEMSDSMLSEDEHLIWIGPEPEIEYIHRRRVDNPPPLQHSVADDMMLDDNEKKWNDNNTDEAAQQETTTEL